MILLSSLNKCTDILTEKEKDFGKKRNWIGLCEYMCRRLNELVGKNYVLHITYCTVHNHVIKNMCTCPLKQLSNKPIMWLQSNAYYYIETGRTLVRVHIKHQNVWSSWPWPGCSCRTGWFEFSRTAKSWFSYTTVFRVEKKDKDIQGTAVLWKKTR